jgi:uncharacterized protein
MTRKLVRGLMICIVLATLPAAVHARDVYIAIIIDDIGNNLERGERAINLPGPVTYSILPYTRFASHLATRAYTARKEVMVHMPMATIDDAPLGPGGLGLRLTQGEFLEVFAAALASVPHARGVNNHMGSYLTQLPLEMSWVMDELKQRKLFFVDSRTSAKSVAFTIARQMGVFSGSRDIFLDNETTPYAIDAAFQQLLQKARSHGTAIGIGHPHDETLEYLALALPQLEADGIRLVPASNLIALQQLQFANRRSTPLNTAATLDSLLAESPHEGRAIPRKRPDPAPIVSGSSR